MADEALLGDEASGAPGHQPADWPCGGELRGPERSLVFNRLRAWLGLRLEMPALLRGLQLPPGARCLEIGSGLAWGGLGLAREFPSRAIISSEIDPFALSSAQEFLAQQDGDVMLMRADARHLPLSDATFDLVLALYVLHHVPGWQPAVAEVGRVTRSGGVFVFAEPLRSSLPGLRRLQARLGALTRHELVEALAAAGFGPVSWGGLSWWAYARATRT